MSIKVFSDGGKEGSVAYDLALTLAAKDESITTPEALLERISSLMPSCLEAAKAFYKIENPPTGRVNINLRR